uniref:Uncharacterized protein n=1 Tax=Scylla olivacea TaxID=85551 RepID=A0A0P4WF74_SCYOL
MKIIKHTNHLCVWPLDHAVEPVAIHAVSGVNVCPCRVLAREEAELAMVRRCLDAKDTRSQELARERERQVARARSTAHTTAALRDNLKKKLAPETFDKVVARANLELRIENRPPATSSMGTRSHIFLG